MENWEMENAISAMLPDDVRLDNATAQSATMRSCQNGISIDRDSVTNPMGIPNQRRLVMTSNVPKRMLVFSSRKKVKRSLGLAKPILEMGYFVHPVLHHVQAA